MRSLLVLVLAACTTPTAPYVQVVLDPGDTWAALYLPAARGWEPLGFTFGTGPSGLPDCDRHWYSEGQLDCQLTVYLYRVPDLAQQAGSNALCYIPERVVNIDASLTGLDLDIATAHEIGHIALDTSLHTRGGIMGGADDRMWDVDKALACQSIHICV